MTDVDTVLNTQVERVIFIQNLKFKCEQFLISNSNIIYSNILN